MGIYHNQAIPNESMPQDKQDCNNIYQESTTDHSQCQSEVSIAIETIP